MFFSPCSKSLFSFDIIWKSISVWFLVTSSLTLYIVIWNSSSIVSVAVSRDGFTISSLLTLIPKLFKTSWTLAPLALTTIVLLLILILYVFIYLILIYIHSVISSEGEG